LISDVGTRDGEILRNDAHSSPAEPNRLFEHRIKHRREVARGGVDDLQYLGGRGLLFQCLVTLGFVLVTLRFPFGKLTLQIGYELLGIG
jgi:hypothetical protein